MRHADYKTCPRCKKNLPATTDCFGKHNKSGLQSWCKACASEYNIKRYRLNPEKAIRRATNWAKLNPERAKTNDKNYRKRHAKLRAKRQRERVYKNIEEYRKRSREWQSSEYGKAWRRKRHHERKLYDLQYIIGYRIRSRVKSFIRGKSQSASTMKLVGCSKKEVVKHLEGTLAEGMTWKDFVEAKIHIDHKIPCASFDLTDTDQQRACFHYSNLQLLWARDNIVKGARKARGKQV